MTRFNDIHRGAILTVENIDEVARLLRESLGGKRFTLVDIRENLPGVTRPTFHVSLDPDDPMTAISVENRALEPSQNFAVLKIDTTEGEWQLHAVPSKEAFNHQYTFVTIEREWIRIDRPASIGGSDGSIHELWTRIFSLLILEGDRES